MRMQPADDQGENGFSGVVESGMQLVCDQSSDLRMRIGSPAICRSRRSRAFSETRMSGSSGCGIGEKNSLWDLRPNASHLLRPEGAPGAGPRLHAPGDMKMPSIHPLTLEKSLKHSQLFELEIADAYFSLGENEEGWKWLEKAYDERSYYMTWLKVDPLFDNIRSDPRFQALLKKVGFE